MSQNASRTTVPLETQQPPPPVSGVVQTSDSDGNSGGDEEGALSTTSSGVVGANPGHFGGVQRRQDSISSTSTSSDSEQNGAFSEHQVITAYVGADRAAQARSSDGNTNSEQNQNLSGFRGYPTPSPSQLQWVAQQHQQQQQQQQQQHESAPPPPPQPPSSSLSSGPRLSNFPPQPPAPPPTLSLGWSRVALGPKPPGQPLEQSPCQRSLHVAATTDEKLYIFGGYDGENRVNDFYEFCFKRRRWRKIHGIGVPPSPRDRHCGCVYEGSFYVFAGFDGTSRVNDFHRYNFRENRWEEIRALHGTPPSPRHSHAAVVHGTDLYVFGGYDGSYRSDFHKFCFNSRGWEQVSASGRVPRARYRATCVTYEDALFVFGGHDGTRHLNDVHIFDFQTLQWNSLATEGPAPLARDSHIAVVHGQSMYVFGGSSGHALNDFHELRLDTCRWSPVVQHLTNSDRTPSHRFCHVGCVSGDCLYVFGGYDGSNRLNDFLCFHFGLDLMSCDIPPSTLITDLAHFVNNESLSDITFIVENRQVHAHKIMLMRCSYFRAMLEGGMREAHQTTVRLEEVRYDIFLKLVYFLYTDECEIALEIAMELFQAADQFGVERLKKMCEKKMLASITVENAALIFHAADVHAAKTLRDKCLNFILANFEKVSKSKCFEEMARQNVELVFEILRKR